MSVLLELKATSLSKRGHLMTEQRHEASDRFDELSVADAVRVMQEADRTISDAMQAAQADIVRAIELVVERLRRGGSLIYVGAGTSGRLGVLDATESVPTFQTRAGQVRGIIAGGARALVGAVEGAEDDEAAARRAVRDDERVGADDVVFGIASGGTTPFVHAAIDEAQALGAATVFLACVPFAQAPDKADVSIRVLTGAEVLSGSTRLKAGTATKLILNQVSTVAMAQLGKCYGNLMVDVDTSANAKLVERAVRIVRAVTREHARMRAIDDDDEALALLRRARGHVKTALVMHACDVDDAERAAAMLGAASGSLRRCLAAAQDAQ